MASDIPAAVTASWPPPNYVDPVSRGPILPASTVVLQIVVFVVVGARLWARFRVLKAPGIDDGLALFAMLPNTALNIALLLAVYAFHFGVHVWDVRPTEFVSGSLITFVIQLTSHWSTSFTKFSILFFYRRLVLGSHSKVFLRIVKVAIAFQMATFITIAVTIFLDCRPLNSLWLSYSVKPRYNQPYTCINNGVFWPIVTGIAALTDFIATVLPSYIVYHLQIPKLQKYIMYAIFSLGFLVCLAGLARMIEYIVVLDYSVDIYWDAYYLWYWTCLEANGALICASAPALKPYIDRFLTKMQSSNGSKSSASRSYTEKGITHLPGPSITTAVDGGTRPTTSNTVRDPPVLPLISKYNNSTTRQETDGAEVNKAHYSYATNRLVRQSDSDERMRASESQDMSRPVEWFSHV